MLKPQGGLATALGSSGALSSFITTFQVAF
jgi:hypothetical protein